MNVFLRSKKCDARVRYNTIFHKSVILAVPSGQISSLVTLRILRSRPWAAPFFTKAAFPGVFRTDLPLGYTSDFTAASLLAPFFTEAVSSDVFRTDLLLGYTSDFTVASLLANLFLSST